MTNKEFVLEMLKVLLPFFVALHLKQPNYMKKSGAPDATKPSADKPDHKDG